MSQTPENPFIQAVQRKIAAGRFDEAVEDCHAVLREKPDDVDALNALGVAYAMAGAPMQSAEAFSLLVIAYPETAKYKVNFVNAVSMFAGITVTTDRPDYIKRAMWVCLEDDDITHRVFNQFWYVLLMQDPVLVQFAAAPESVSFEDLRAPLSDRFLHIGLKRLIGAGCGDFERLMTALRCKFLMTDLEEISEFLSFLCALAEQCFMNEYVYACSDEEWARVKALEEELREQSDFTDAASMVKVALVGCYKDIYRESYAAAIDEAEAPIENEAFLSLVELLIADPIEVDELRDGIPTLSAIDNEVSAAVRAQYEDNPYPRWRNILRPTLSKEQIALGEGRKILVAGCGTGQELVSLASYYPKAEITAIDLSFSSLSYAKQKAIEFGIQNVTFMQADILDVEALDQQFDFITSSGVLHHMKDPIAGWRALLGVLKSDGVMKIALYSAAARRDIIAAQAWIKEQGFKADRDGISAFRQVALDGKGPEFLAPITVPTDFYAMSMCRDMVFHVQEHNYSLPEIGVVLNELGLSLSAFKMAQPATLQAYRAQFPDDPQGLSLENWHAFEQQNPDAFIAMYNFCCMREENGAGVMPAWLYTY